MDTSDEKLRQELQAWQKLMARELKTETPSLENSMGIGLTTPILHYQSSAQSPQAFSVAAMSQTLTRASGFNWSDLENAFDQGVYDFIFDPHLLGWSKIECADFIKEHSQKALAFKGRIWGLGVLSKLGHQVIDAQELTIQGGHTVHELGFLLHQVIQWATLHSTGTPVALSVEMETDFFRSIAKKRALSLMIESVLESLDKKEWRQDILIMARSPWRTFTAFDYHSNILRNATALSAAYITGCDIVESLPFDLMVELDEIERAKAKRVALTTQLILQNESMLSEVRDPAHGSYALENLTELFIQESWAFMQKLQSVSETSTIMNEVREKNWSETMDQFNKRKIIQAGVNDFAQADSKVVIHPRWLKQDHVRLGREFEELRCKQTTRCHVKVAIVGSYASLQARANFTKNYFELLGFIVEEKVFTSVSEAKSWLQSADVNAWVTSDDLHPQLSAVGKRCYLAGKTKIDGCHNIFVGQDVLSVLKELSLWLQGEVK